MKATVLDLVQNILSALDSDEVNSISDTTESRQVAQIVKTSYFNIMARADLPEHKAMFNLDASLSGDQPVLMSSPENVRHIEWIKYDVRTEEIADPTFRYVIILPLEQFLDTTQGVTTTDTTVGSMMLNGMLFYFKNNAHPCYCTIINDHLIVFDSYNSAVDTTLQSSKTMAFGLQTPTFLVEDNFIPEMDEQQFPLLLNEAKSLAFVELKQINHEKAEQESRRQWRTLQRTKDLKKPSYFDQLPNFGRTRGYGYSYGPGRFRERQ
jgi:hypothetical protein